MCAFVNLLENKKKTQNIWTYRISFKNEIFFIYCRYEFVKQLKRKIEELLGQQIEEEIEKQATAGHVDNGQETLVSKITDSIIKSRPYVPVALWCYRALDKKDIPIEYFS